MSDYFICPHCGVQVDWDAPACPECGSDDDTGWAKGADSVGLFLYDDYDPQVEPPPVAAAPWPRLLVIAIVLLTVSALLLLLGGSWGIYLVALLFLVVVVAYYMGYIFPETARSREQGLYRDLLRKTRYDEELVERLIMYEQRRSPESTRLEAIEDAIRQWERDNR